MQMRVSLALVMCLTVIGPQTPGAQTPAAPGTCPEMATALTR
jgi:hypothetical protein